MKLNELKENINKLPDYLDNVEVFIAKVEENGFWRPSALDKVVYSGTEVCLISDYHKEQKDDN